MLKLYQIKWICIIILMLGLHIPTRTIGAKSLDSVPSLLFFHFGDSTWELDLKEVGFDGVDPTTIDHQRVYDWIQTEIAPQVEKEPISAHYMNRKIIPHEHGVRINYKKIEENLFLIHDKLNKVQFLPVHLLTPELTTSKLETLKEQKLSSYQTFFNPHNENRSHNIEQSSKAIDHYVVMPGQVFSFNKVVGIRTIQRGYKPARIIVRGEYSEGIGGGICQTSSTLFNSVDKAGLKVLQRYSHSKNVPYVPKNRDATVSWGGYDFKFKNQLNEPVIIVSNISHGILNISIYGPKSIHFLPKDIPSSPPISAQEEEE